MSKENQQTPQTNTHWYFEPLNALSNEMIVGLGEGIDECPDKEVVSLGGVGKKVNLLRVEESKASFIWGSKKFKKMSVVLYRQEGDGPVIEYRRFIAQKPDPFLEAKKKRTKKAKQGLPVRFFSSVH